MEQAFVEFSSKLKPEGLLVSKFGLKKGSVLKAPRHLTYSLQNESADVYAKNIRLMNGSYEFDVAREENILENMVLQMGGMHNIENAVASIAVAGSLGIASDKIKAAVEAFKGVKRRFEYVITPSIEKGAVVKPVFIDDYAHHPEELKALISGAKSLFRQRKCTVIFQPHLFTRTRDLAEGFARSLDLADEVILLPIYPAREEPIPGVTSKMILDKMENINKRIFSKDELLTWMKEKYIRNINKEFGEVLITAGAGDIDALVEPIKEIVEKVC
jgi:UDP-N-acetylmuramate--alanine ligase